MTIAILMTRGYDAIIDDCDKDLAELKWASIVRADSIVYATTRINKKQVYMHRIVLSRILGRELSVSELVDHINHDGTDNTRDNLRLATHRQNLGNSRKHVASENPYKGVHKNAGTKNPWAASIFKNGISTHLGVFKTAESAHLAYCVQALMQWGEFAHFGNNSPFKGWTLEQLQNTSNVAVHRRKNPNGRSTESYEPFVMPDSEWLK